MSLSTSIVTPGNIVLSPQRIKFNGVDLGGTKGGVTVSPKFELADIMVDQFGKTVIDKKVSGYAFTVKFELAEIGLKDNWKIAFPHAKLISGSSKSVYFDLQIGDSLLAHAAQLLLHPLDHGDSDLTGDVLLYKAAATSVSEVKYGPDAQSGLSVEMVIFPDTSVSPAKLMLHGDPANGLVAASAGTPAFTGTGNGTITSVSTGSATKTETITVKCVGIPAANQSNWLVTGSVSGTIGHLELTGGAGGTSAFTSNLINFTITDGGTDFVINDQWTIATTAANYA